jgi:two-component system nitrate/nitrite response regulator NarL
MGSKTPGPIRVLIADDQPLYRVGLSDAIEQRPGLELVGQAESGSHVLDQIRSLKPDVAVLAIKPSGLDGVEVAYTLARDGLPSRVLFLSAYIDGDTVYRALEAGAHGYISKDCGAGAICDAVAAVAHGQIVLGPDSQKAIAEQIRLRTAGKPRPLSDRELQVLSLIADGYSVSEIADRLYLSPFTVKTHIKRAYRKLGVSGRGAAVAEAMRRGLLKSA